MFTLYTESEARRVLSPEEYAMALSPGDALRQVKMYYDLDPRKYGYFGFSDIPNRLHSGVQSWRPAPSGFADKVYDAVKYALETGSLVGIDRSKFLDEQFRRHHVRSEQSTPPEKTLNSKGVGRLLAAGGVYNGNVEGFRKTAEQLGGDAPAGYDQMLNETTKGAVIAVASVAAGIGIGRLNAAGEVGQLSNIEKLEPILSRSGFISKSGFLTNAEKAVIDPNKLISYALNPDHPIGGNKARVFESALGYNQSNVGDLITKVQAGAVSNPAVILTADKFGQRMAVDMPITGVNGNSAIVRTGWIYDAGSSVPRLTTIFVK